MKYPFTRTSPIPKWLCSIFIFATMYLATGIQVQASPEDWPVYESEVLPSMNESPAMPCLGLVQLSLDENGQARITPKMVISDPSISVSSMKTIVIETNRSTVDCSDIGKNRSVKLIDTITGNSCWAKLLVEDKLRPDVRCESDTLICTVDPFTVDYENLIEFIDNCDNNPTVQFGIQFQKLNCDPIVSSIMHVNYIVTDKYGNKASCTKDVVFKKVPLDSIVFPLNDTIYCDTLASSGVPSFRGEPVSISCDLIATNIDDTIVVCGGMYKINRRWTVMDWCLRSSITRMQEVLVSDTTRPNFNCLADTTILNRTQNCYVRYLLPRVIATDECSPANLLYHIVRIDSSYNVRPGEFVNLDAGIHTLNYVVMDPCGNSDTCTRKITVIDKSSPSLVCPGKLVVSLGVNGTVQVDIHYLERFIHYSDNCGISDIEIRRMTNRCGVPQDTLYDHEVTFCCLDVGFAEMLWVRVIDDAGNSNFCMIPVEVQNKLIFNIACPANITLNCDQDEYNLNVTGRPIITNLCSNLTSNITYRDSGILNACNIGVINRKFFIELANGAVDSSCSHRITFTNNVSTLMVQWPNDTTISGCRSNHPDSIRSRPIVLNYFCSQIVFNYRDSMSVLPQDSCPRILRMWSSVAGCGFPVLRDTQTIILVDLNAPKLTGPKDTFHCVEDTFCHPFIVLPALVIKGCNNIVSVTNNYTNGGANCSGIYPLGRHIVIFTVTDACNHVVRDTVIVEIVDKIAPIIGCRTIVRNIQLNDSAKIIARDLLIPTFSDNCTPKGQLIISFSSTNPNDTCRFISCSQHTPFPDSLWPFTVFVKDLSGNTALCIGRVDVNDPNGFCNNLVGRKIDVYGLVRSSAMKPMANVSVNEMLEHKEVKTDFSGTYEIKDCAENGKVEVFPKYNEDWLEGVSTIDIVRIQKHILGVDLFTNPFEWIAADINKDGKITSHDVSILRKLILGKINDVNENTSYRFIQENYIFKDLDYPLNDLLPESIKIDSLKKETSINFSSIKVGDVSGIKANLQGSIYTRNRFYSIGVQDLTLTSSITMISPFLAEQDITVEGFQLRIQFDQEFGIPVGIIDYSNSATGVLLEEDNYYIQGNELVISYNKVFPKRLLKGDKLFSIAWKTHTTCKLSQLIRETNFTENEVFVSGYSAYPLIVHINYSQNDINVLEIDNFKLAPNPFTQDCIISFESNIDVISNFNVFSSDGKAVLTRNIPLIKGINSFTINRVDIGSPGVYHYQFKIGNILKKGKIVLTK